MAAEVFAVCGVGKFLFFNWTVGTHEVPGAFLPVTLEQLARENGMLWSNKTTSCMDKAASGATNATMAALVKRVGQENNDQCIIRPLGSEITTASFAMYTFSLAVLIQALTLVSFSSFADHGVYSNFTEISSS